MFNYIQNKSEIYDETISKEGIFYDDYKNIFKYFETIGFERFQIINEYVSKSLLNQGASYIVYGKGNSIDKAVLPFDLIPRIIGANEWQSLEKGLIQRNTALNLFLNDAYRFNSWE